MTDTDGGQHRQKRQKDIYDARQTLQQLGEKNWGAGIGGFRLRRGPSRSDELTQTNGPLPFASFYNLVTEGIFAPSHSSS